MRTVRLTAVFLAVVCGGALLMAQNSCEKQPQVSEAYKALQRSLVEKSAEEIKGTNRLTAGLNHLANEGWELIGIDAHDDGQSIYVFRREAR